MSRGPESLLRGRRAIAGIVAATTLAATGCAALIGIEDRFADESDAASDATAEASTSDATTDAASSDATTSDTATSDAPVDGGSVDALLDVALLDGGDAAIAFCKDPLAGWKFCDDFDDGGLGATWSGQDTLGTGTLSFSLDAAVSPSRSLQATTPNATTSLAEQAYLYRTIPISSTSTEIHLVFRAQVTSLGGGGQFDLVQVGTSISNTFTFTVDQTLRPHAYEFLYDGQATVDSGATALGDEILPTSQWMQIEMDLFPKAATPYFNIKVDGRNLVGNQPFKFAPTVGSDFYLTVGLVYSEGKWIVRVDDVGVRTLP